MCLPAKPQKALTQLKECAALEEADDRRDKAGMKDEVGAVEMGARAC
jgi:hypothetical protein